MNTKQSALRSISQKIIDEYISQLLAKPDVDTTLDSDLYGYPANYLDDPRNKTSRARLKNRFFEGMDRYIDFEIMRTVGADLAFGTVLESKAKAFLIDIGTRKLKVASKKLRSLLYSSAENGRMVMTKTGEVFVIRLDTRLLLDCV